MALQFESGRKSGSIAHFEEAEWLSGSIWQAIIFIPEVLIVVLLLLLSHQEALHEDYGCLSIIFLLCHFFLPARKEHAEASYELMTAQKRLEKHYFVLYMHHTHINYFYHQNLLSKHLMDGKCWETFKQTLK